MNDNLGEEAAVYNTTAFHITLSIALSCMFYITFYLPLVKSKKSMILTFCIWCIVIPIIVVVSGGSSLSLIDETSFTNIKIISLIVILGFIQLYIYNIGKNNKIFNTKYLTIGVLSLLIINILEAVGTQFSQYYNDDTKQVDKVIDLGNSIVGVILSLCLVYIIFMGRKKDQMSVKNLRLYSKIGFWWVLAYTLWNTLFRIQMYQNTVVLIFFVVTMLVPISLYYYTKGNIDFIQFRAGALLFYILLMVGFTKGDGNAFPIYNLIGYNEQVDKNNIITKIQEDEIFRYIILAMTILSVVMAVIETK